MRPTLAVIKQVILKFPDPALSSMLIIITVVVSLGLHPKNEKENSALSGIELSCPACSTITVLIQLFQCLFNHKFKVQRLVCRFCVPGELIFALGSKYILQEMNANSAYL